MTTPRSRTALARASTVLLALVVVVPASGAAPGPWPSPYPDAAFVGAPPLDQLTCAVNTKPGTTTKLSCGPGAHIQVKKAY